MRIVASKESLSARLFLPLYSVLLGDYLPLGMAPDTSRHTEARDVERFGSIYEPSPSGEHVPWRGMANAC
jgi:hypothetical protein